MKVDQACRFIWSKHLRGGHHIMMKANLLAPLLVSALLVSACGQASSGPTNNLPANSTSANQVANSIQGNSSTQNQTAPGANQTSPAANNSASTTPGAGTNPTNSTPAADPTNPTNSTTSNATSPSVNTTTPGTGTGTPPATGNTTQVPVVELSNVTRAWYYMPNTTHTTPAIAADASPWLVRYAGYYVGNTKQKNIYLTFDEGYENGYTAKILDTLKQNSVHAAFFVTASYIRNNPDLVRRMAAEGHLVANHSSTHPSMPSLVSNSVRFNNEFADTESAYKSVTGKALAKFFRPPMGEYSQKTLYLTQQLGYKTVFWSFAHRDWETNNQPPVSVTHDRILTGAHPGAILLLHAVSQSDTDALSSVILDLQYEGYVFHSLNEL